MAGKRVERAAAVGGVALLVSAVLRRDAVVALVVLGVVFAGLESWRPLRPSPFLRPGFGTDLVHFLADELLSGMLVAATLVVALPVLALVFVAARAVVGGQPVAVRWIESLVLGEICGYWGHRLEHEVPLLWRFHKVHHSIERMDWLAPSRRHPVDLAVSRLSVALPLLALGFSVPNIAAHFAVKRFQGLLVHANLRIDFGPLRWIVATPQFHHWHHAGLPHPLDKNFAGQLPAVDWLFGTLLLPRHEWPVVYGIGEPAPEGWLAQMAWPFRRVAGAEVAVVRPLRLHLAPVSPSAGSAGSWPWLLGRPA